MMTTSVLTLPVASIQHTFPEVLQEVEDGILPSDKFWVSCYKTSERSVHAKVSAELDDRDRNLVVLKVIEGNVEVSKDANGVSLLNVVFLALLFCKSLLFYPCRLDPHLIPARIYAVLEATSSFFIFSDGFRLVVCGSSRHILLLTVCGDRTI